MADPGFYFRVIEEGEVEAGEEIVQVTAGPERMTIAEVNALLYTPGHSRSQLERAVRIPALSAGWRSSFQALLDPEWSGGAVLGTELSIAGSAPAITARVDPIGTPTVCDRVRTGRGKSGAEGQSHSQWLVLLAQKAMPGRYPDRLSTKSARRLIARRSGPPY